MALETYRTKRDFKTTPEPRGKKIAAGKGDTYLIQKHDARRLHYDLRLEMDGVLKSWALTRGPSLVPGEKRLAVHVEDHPLEYGEFEGTIPKGEYGGGSVIVWDLGRWKPIGDAHEGYAKGHLEFELSGEKLRGRWHLVRMAGKPREKRDNWLLVKGEDDAARPAGSPDILEERPESVKTGRLVEQIAGEQPGWSSKIAKSAKEAEPPSIAPDGSKLKGAKKAALPASLEPALATLVAKPPSGRRWVHEIKLDGYRLLARLEAGRVKLLTRGGLDWTGKFGNDMTAAFKALPVGAALIDGELVVENQHGASDFSLLQADLSESRTDRFIYYAFDLLHLDGYDLQDTPLVVRKQALEQLLSGDPGRLHYSEHLDQEGDLILRHACRLSLEGIVSKLRAGPYRSGRGKGWVKSRCSQRQEFVIGGYVPSSTSRQAIGSLVLGYYADGKLMHAGRVGTGYTAAVATDLYRRLKRLSSPTSPFAERLSAEAALQVRYVKPELVAEVEFRHWTADQNLSRAAFRGLREDKAVTEVVREAATGAAEPTPKASAKLTHPDRVYWPDAGITKEGLAQYYADAWRRMAPFIVARPLSLVRCPQGVTGQCFFQKHAWQGLSRSIQRLPDPKDRDDELLVINDVAGLIGLVQAGVLEVHPWGASLAALEQPDIVIMDLDPGESVGWPEVIAAAIEVRDRLAALGLTSFAKTSGGKGLHVVVPLKPKADWPAVKAFTKAMAEAMAADSPGKFVATVTKSKRRGRILVDYLRNSRGTTAVAPYSTRARPGAAVSMPLGWDELSPAIGPAYFTVANSPTRLANMGVDPWADFRRAAVPLPAAKSSRKRAG